MSNELVVAVNNSPNLLALIRKIKMSIHMIEWINLGHKDIELISEDTLSKEPLSPGNMVHFFSKKDTYFSEDIALDV